MPEIASTLSHLADWSGRLQPSADAKLLAMVVLAIFPSLQSTASAADAGAALGMDYAHGELLASSLVNKRESPLKCGPSLNTRKAE